jgi:hypothetical protein
VKASATLNESAALAWTWWSRLSHAESPSPYPSAVMVLSLDALLAWLVAMRLACALVG